MHQVLDFMRMLDLSNSMIVIKVSFTFSLTNNNYYYYSSC